MSESKLRNLVLLPRVTHTHTALTISASVCLSVSQGLIVCCEIEEIVSEPSVLTNVHYREAKNDGIEGSDPDVGDSGAGPEYVC